ncbi:transglycosylase SLT domain-containing protein [Acinetobacter ursingii]|uniref:transglycosylase SLT domain-containing protein n=1 Tax=Acinetobacter ursingii TaxID=108980 RepID=UPI0021CDA9E8|nr:transglycosylase SLT domain-containing protein [Acinetobacter ursingii]MCU4601858.1 transglycosylase SLT domain-containing protein [Acinetobacter ursingii]
MAGKNLKVALQVQADLNQARREVKGLKSDIIDTTKAADSNTSAQKKTSQSVAITADEIKKLSSATDMGAGISQLKGYENQLNKTTVASKEVSNANGLIENSVKSLTPHLLSLIGVSGTFIGVAVDTLNKAANLQKYATLSGTGVEDFQYHAAGAKTVGIEMDKLGDIYKDVRDKVGDFIANGGGELQDFFENVAPKVGVTAEQFKKLSGPEALQLYVDSLQKAGVSQNEMVFYLEAIANDATLLLPLLQNGGEGWKKYGDQAKNAGAILGQNVVVDAVKAKNAINTFKTNMEGATNHMVAKFSPAIVFVAQNLDLLVKAGLILISVYAGRMIPALTASTIAFIAGRIEAARYQMTLASMAGVATTTAVRLSALQTISSLLVGAGGLPGLAIAAAGIAASFLLLDNNADQATDTLNDQTKTVSELAEEYKKLDQVQQRIALRKATEEQERLTVALSNQQSQLVSLIDIGTRSSTVSDAQRKKALELASSYKQGKISANELVSGFQSLNTVSNDFKNRADEVANSTNKAKSELDKQNQIIDVYTGKTNSAITSTDTWTGSVNSLTKAYQDLVKTIQDNTFSNLFQIDQMKAGIDPELASKRAKALADLNADPKSTQTYFRLPDSLDAQITNDLKVEKERAALEEKITKEKEKQKEAAKQTAKINSTVLAYAQKYNFEGLEQQYKLPRGLLAATAMQESGGNRNAVSPAGAVGLMQLMPATAQRFKVTDRTDVAQSVLAAAKYYQFLLKKFDGDLDKAIMGYNAGEGNVDNGKAYGFKETQKYLPAIKKYLAGYNGLIDENAQSNLSKMLAAENDFQKKQTEQNEKRISLRESLYSEEEKLIAEHNKKVKEITEAGFSPEETKSLLAKENQRYEEALTKRTDIFKRVQDALPQIEQSLLKANGQDLQADLDAVEEKYKQLKADFAALLLTETDPAKAAQYQQLLFKIDFVIDKEQITLQFNDAMKQLNDLQNLRQQKQDNLKLQYDSGQISQPQYSQGLKAIDVEMKPQLQGLIELAKQLAVSLGDAFSVEKLNAMNIELNKTDASFRKFLPTIEQIQENIAGGMTNAIMDWADGTKSAGDAFRQFASDFLREIAQMILKQMIFNAVKAASSYMGYSDGGLVTGYSTGGYTGIGGKYEPAGIVHKDEFVIRKESTSQSGAKEFLTYFNRYGMQALNQFKNGYADGGIVGAPNISVPNIQAPKLNDPISQISQATSFSANQQFLLVDDPSRLSDYIKSGEGQETLVVMMSRDPAKFKAALKIGG